MCQIKDDSSRVINITHGSSFRSHVHYVNSFSMNVQRLSEQDVVFTMFTSFSLVVGWLGGTIVWLRFLRWTLNPEFSCQQLGWVVLWLFVKHPWINKGLKIHLFWIKSTKNLEYRSASLLYNILHTSDWKYKVWSDNNVRLNKPAVSTMSEFKVSDT